MTEESIDVAANYCAICGAELRDAWAVSLAGTPKEHVRLATAVDDGADELSLFDGHATVEGKTLTVYRHADAEWEA